MRETAETLGIIIAGLSVVSAILTALAPSERFLRIIKAAISLVCVLVLAGLIIKLLPAIKSVSLLSSNTSDDAYSAALYEAGRLVRGAEYSVIKEELPALKAALYEYAESYFPTASYITVRFFLDDDGSNNTGAVRIYITVCGDGLSPAEKFTALAAEHTGFPEECFSIAMIPGQNS